MYNPAGEDEDTAENYRLQNITCEEITTQRVLYMPELCVGEHESRKNLC